MSTGNYAQHLHAHRAPTCCLCGTNIGFEGNFGLLMEINITQTKQFSIWPVFESLMQNRKMELMYAILRIIVQMKISSL